jgi:beta-lactamase class A
MAFTTARERGDFDRLLIWWDALKLSSKWPILGIGPGNYPRFARRYAMGYLRAPNLTRHWLAATSSAHGNFPQIAAELGWLSLGATVWIILLAVQTSWHLFRTIEDPFLSAFALGIGASIVGQLVTSLFADYILPCYHNGGYVNISSTIYFWIMIGLLMALDALQMGGTDFSSAALQVSWPSLGKWLIPLVGCLVFAALVEVGIAGVKRRRTDSRQSRETLDNHIQRRVARFSGRVGVYAKDITSGEVYTHRSEELFPAASLFKVFVLVELMRRVEEGTIRLDDRLTVDRKGISSSGPGVLRYLQDLPEVSVNDCCRLMVTWSDDVATDLLLKMIELDRIGRTLSELGLSRSHVAGNCTLMKYRMAGIEPCVVNEENEQLLEERLAVKDLFEAGFSDSSPAGTVTTPREMGLLFESLIRAELISPEASDRMLHMLTDATKISRSMIPRFQPEGVLIAHRAGGSWRVLADAGVIATQGRPLIVAIFTHHEPDERGAGDLVADLSRILFEWSRSL